MKSREERRSGWPLIIGIIAAVMALTTGPALAALTFSGTSISGDGAVVIDSSSTISIGTSTATGITIGRTGQAVNFPGNLSTISATTTNLAITALGTSGSNCLTVSAAGNVATTTCGGSSQWTTSGTAISYNAGNVGIGASLPAGAPAGSIAANGNGYFRNLTLDPTLGNYFTGESGASFKGAVITGGGNSGSGRALWSLSSGINNSGFGLDSLGFTSTGYENAGFGVDTLAWNSLGYENSAMAQNALWSNTSGYDNTGDGFNACFSNTSADHNTCLGAYADFLTPNLNSATFTATNGTSNLSVGSYFYAVTFVLNGSETALSGGGYFGTTTDASHREITIGSIPLYTGPLTATARKIYRTQVSNPGAAGPARRWYLLTTIADNTTTAYVDSTADASLGPEETGLPHMSMMLGSWAQAYKSNQAIFGSPSAPVTELWFNGVYNTAPYAIQLSSSGGSGTNVGGADLTFQGGPGTGSASGGAIRFKTCPAGSSGSLWNPCTEVARITQDGFLVLDQNMVVLSGATYKQYWTGPDYSLSLDSGIQWKNNPNVFAGAYDAGLSRCDVGKVCAGNGTIGDYSGTLIAGTVGIGTTAPSTTLQIAGTLPTLRIGASSLAGCLEVGNSDGTAGINYITVLNGVLTATTTKPSACQ